jgi:hypothetical protein
MDLQFDGPEQGSGSSVQWTGKAGTGSLSILRAGDSGVAYHMEMSMGGMKADGEVTLQPNANATKVAWTDDLKLGANPLYRWIGLAMGGMRRKNLEDGLAQLKRVAEGEPAGR